MTSTPRAPTLAASATPPNSAFALSVVVGSVDSSRTIARALSALEVSTAGIDAEIIVVDASTDGTGDRIRARHPNVGLRQLTPGTLMPRLWSAGYTMSRGRVVAFTTGHCVVSESWARAVLAAIDRGATGVSGSLGLSDESGVVDQALFYLRYSAFLGAGESGDEVVREIPGDNAAYPRDALERHAASFGDGFWEVDFHRRLRVENSGARLVFVPGARADFGPSASFVSLTRQRFAHGCHSGAWRAHTGVRSVPRIALAAPLVPFVLVARIARRVLSRPAHRGRFLIALPVTFAFAVAWAAGEAWGALSDRRVATLRKPRLAS